MSTVTKRIEQPVTYKEVTVLTCDGCAKEVTASIGAQLGWLQQKATEEDGKGGVAVRDLADYCTDCRPKIERAQKQEADAIKAEALAAQADAVGVV